MKKALILAVLVLVAPFSYAHGALLPNQPSINNLVSTSTAFGASWWIGTGDGVTIINTLSHAVWAEGGASTSVRYTCFASQATTSSPAPSQAGCLNASAVQSLPVQIPVGGSNIAPVYNYYFQDDTPLQNGKWYFVELLVQGANNGIEIYGQNGYQIPYQCVYGGSSARCTGTPMWIANTTFDFLNGQATATSSSLFSGQNATSTLQALQDQCSQSGNIFAEGICIAFSFLFVPSPNTLAKYQYVSAIAETKIPFSYVSSIENAFNNITLNATSSMPIITIPLSSVASSSITGVIPDLTISTTTISTYLSDNIRLGLHSILIALIWLSAGFLVFNETVRLLKT